MTYPPQQNPYHPYPEASQATTILVLGILGLIVCQVLSPIAWYMGNQELTGIDTGRRDPSARSTANAGRILGIIGTVFLIIGFVALFGFLVVALVISESATADLGEISENVLGSLGAL